MANKWKLATSTDVAAASAGSSKQVFYVKAGANLGTLISRITLGMTGTDFSKKAMTVEAFKCTGTATASSETITSRESTLAANSHSVTGARNVSSGLTLGASVWGPFKIQPYGGIDDRFPLGEEIELGKAEAIVIVVTTPTGGDTPDISCAVEGNE